MSGAPKSLDDTLREYVADDVPRKIERAEALARQALRVAEEAKEIAQAVSFEWHDQRDALQRHVDTVTDALKSEIAQVGQQAERAGTLSQQQLDVSKRHGRALARLLRSQKASSTERRHQLKVLSTKIPIYVALISLVGTVLTVLLTLYAMAHGWHTPATSSPTPTIPSAQ